MRDPSFLENGEQLEQRFVLEGNIVVGAIGGEVLLSALAVSLQSVLEFFLSDSAFHIFIEY